MATSNYIPREVYAQGLPYIPKPEQVLDLPDREVVRIAEFYQPWPKQQIFHAMGAKHRLQVGGFGSAKSRALLMEAVTYCIENPGINAIILRKTMPDLKRTVIDKFETDVPKSLYEKGSQEKGTFNKSDHIVYFPPAPGPVVELLEDGRLSYVFNDDGTVKEVMRQSKLYFAACERIEDVGKYLSTEFTFVGFEELGEFPYLIYDAMEGRNRSTVPGVFPCMASATNPMGIGWGWIKKLWVDKKPCYGMNPEKYTMRDYDYVHSTVDDNPILSRDQQYIDSLEKSPLRDKIRWGKLDQVSGQYYDNFDPTRHVVSASRFLFEPWQPVWVGWDYGFGHFAVITFMTKATLIPRFETEKPRMVNVLLKEIVLHENTPTQQTEALIKAIPKAFDEHGNVVGYKWDIDSIHFSWERFNRVVSNRTIADDVGDLLSAAGLPRPTRSNNDRIAGWTKMYEMFDTDEFFLIEGQTNDCAEAIPLLVRGNGVTCSMEDVVKPKDANLPDDCADSMRYAVAGFLLDPADKPKKQLLREKLAGIEDPMAKFVVGYTEWNRQQAEDRETSGGGKIIPSWMRRIKH